MDQKAADFSARVLRWHRLYGRHDLPWQYQQAYPVWISEIMLQQTQVSTVIPYYLNFLERFPNIKSLADASIDAVLQQWQGLGYYARARNLHRAAQIIRDQHQGQFPQTFEAVEALPGIGRSTAGAILGFACEQSWPILDGNVKRVLARCFQVEGWYGKSATMKRLWQLSEALTPKKQTAVFNQAMMDIGSMICLKSKPECKTCPLQELCASYQHSTQALYPAKKPKKAKPHKQTLMLLHRYDEQLLLWRRPPSGIWGGLWSLPEVEGESDIEDWQQNRQLTPQAPTLVRQKLIHHQFSHYSLDISLAEIELAGLPQAIADNDDYHWVKPADIASYGLPAPVRKILQQVL